MITRTLARRLEHLEAKLAPASDKPALTILLTSVGQPDQIIDVRGPKPLNRRLSWQPRPRFEGRS